MFVQIIRLEGTLQIKLSKIILYNIFNVEINLDTNVIKATQSSDGIDYDYDYQENPLLESKIVNSKVYNAKNPIKGTLTKTSGNENGWWEIDLNSLIEIGKIKINQTNVGKIICMNSDRKILYTESRDGFFSFENPPDYIINLPHTYYLSDSTFTNCINGKVYEYQSCKSSNELSCPPKYVPLLKSPIHHLITLSSNTDTSVDKKWAILSEKDCGEIYDTKKNTKYNLKNPSLWSDCINSQKVRQWNDCENKESNCPDNLPYKETQSCSNGELVWGEWSSCTNNLNDPIKGTKSRKAICNPPVNGGEPCPDTPIIETKDCTNYQLSQWSDFTECKIQPDGTMGIARTRFCIDGTNGGTECKNLPLNQSLIEIHPCSDGKPSQWSEWSKCESGEQNRTRQCILPVNGGKECDPNTILQETQKCADSVLSPWSQWSKCNGAYQTRDRICTPPIGAGIPCNSNESLHDIKPCTNVWSDCNLTFYQVNENGDSRSCTPTTNITILLALIVLLIIIINISYAI